MFTDIADASVAGLGAILEQKQRDGSIRPLGFLSRTTNPSETWWSPTELGSGAIVRAIKKNRNPFYGFPIEASTFAKHGELSRENHRVQRWFDFLAAYTYDLKYKPGREMPI